MAIKQSTEQKILSAMAGHDEWACIGSYYTPWWTTPCLCGHPIKTVFVIGHAGDHGPAYSQPTLHIGSECFKYLLKNPRFAALSEDLQAKRKEIERIQRRMKRMREDEFHATGTWKAMASRLYDIEDIFRFTSVSSFGDSLMRRAHIDPQTLDREMIRKGNYGHKLIYKIYNMDVRFQDDETAANVVESLERMAKDIVDGFRPFKQNLQDFQARTGGILSPGAEGARVILERLG